MSEILPPQTTTCPAFLCERGWIKGMMGCVVPCPRCKQEEPAPVSTFCGWATLEEAQAALDRARSRPAGS
jgi:hypothetical protein